MRSPIPPYHGRLAHAPSGIAFSVHRCFCLARGFSIVFYDREYGPPKQKAIECDLQNRDTLSQLSITGGFACMLERLQLRWRGLRPLRGVFRVRHAIKPLLPLAGAMRTSC